MSASGQYAESSSVQAMSACPLNSEVRKRRLNPGSIILPRQSQRTHTLGARGTIVTDDQCTVAGRAAAPAPISPLTVPRPFRLMISAPVYSQEANG